MRTRTVQPFQCDDEVFYKGDFYDGRDRRLGKVLGVRIENEHWQLSTTANKNWLHVHYYEPKDSK